MSGADGARIVSGADGGGRGTLYLVATPIGNLGDVTLRALEVLRSVDVVAAEDTRTSRVLLARHAIRSRLVSYHARNEATRAPELLARLRAGERVALVTDAGTPGVSDPGAELSAAWAAEGGRVVPIPGASAVLAAVAGSALAGPRWCFEGFLPRRGRERRERLARIAADERGTVVYEAANRTAVSLADLAAACGAERPGAVCRELTKLHEEVLRGLASEVLERVEASEPKGEVVLVIEGATGEASPDPASLVAEARALVAGGRRKREAAAEVARRHGASSNEIYRMLVDG